MKKSLEMQGQLSIFDFLEPTDDFRAMTEKEVMDIISERIGVRLKWDGFFEQYCAKIGKIKIFAEIDYYVMDGFKYIGVSWQGATEGGASPCNSLDDAVKYLQTNIARHGGRKRKECLNESSGND